MKIYPVNVEIPVNSSARAPEDGYIPPFTISGAVRSGLTGEWSPPSDVVLVTGGVIYVQLINPLANVTFALVKHNVFERNILVGQASFYGGGSLSGRLHIEPPITGRPIVTPYDTLQLASFVSVPGQTVRDFSLQLSSIKVQ